MSQTDKTKQSKEFDEYECGGNGPRWPVYGEESKISKMTTDEPSNSILMAERKSLKERVAKWQDGLINLLGDEEGVKLLFKFVEKDVGTDSVYHLRLEFYFACNGLKSSDEEDETRIRQIIRAIHR